MLLGTWLSDMLRLARTPDEAYIALNTEEQKRIDRRIAFWIGMMSIGLAPALITIDGFDGPECLRLSISAYYFAPVAGGVFVFVLSFVAAFLFRYRGENALDGILATIAGLAAILVALVPTNLTGFCAEKAGPVDISFPFRFTLTETSGLFIARDTFGDISETAMQFPLNNPEQIIQTVKELHFGAAAGLILILFYFALIAFTRVRESDRMGNAVVWQKWVRNALYVLSSLGMAVAFVVLIWHWRGDLETLWGYPAVFFGEALALASFGVAWMVKGRFWFGWLDSPDEASGQPAEHSA